MHVEIPGVKLVMSIWDSPMRSFLIGAGLAVKGLVTLLGSMIFYYQTGQPASLKYAAMAGFAMAIVGPVVILISNLGITGRADNNTNILEDMTH